MSAAALQRRAKKSAPQRTCIGCRKASDVAGLVRLTRSPAGEVVVDHPKRLGGRGAWVCASPRCLSRASKRGNLARALGGPVEAVGADAIEARIRERIQARVDGLLAAAGRARKVAVGAADAEGALRRGEVRLLVLAEDLSERVAKNLAALADSGRVAIVRHGDRDRLGLTMARSLVGSVAIVDDGLASAVEQELALLGRLDGDGAPADTKCTSPAGEAEALERAT